MARREVKDLWENNNNRLTFLSNNGIKPGGTVNSLPPRAYESISKEDRIHRSLKSIHDNIFRFLLRKYKLLGDQYNYGDRSEFLSEEERQTFISTDKDYESNFDFENTALIDLILDDKQANETLEEYEERLLNGDIESIDNGEHDTDAGIIHLIQDLVNFKLLLYMLCQVNETETEYTKIGEFQLEDFSIIMSGNEDLHLEPRNIEVVHKINTLFINSIKLNKYHDLCNLYFNHLDEDLRMFHIRQEKVTLKTYKKRIIEEELEDGTIKEIEKEVIEDTERILNIISVNKNSMIYRNWCVGNHFEKILNNPWYYEYKPNTNINILTPDLMGQKYIPSKRMKDYSKKEYETARTIKDLFSKETIESGHKWEATETIEYHMDRKTKNPIRNSQGFIEVNSNRSAKSLDKKLTENGHPNKAIWESVRSKTAAVNKINYSTKNREEKLIPVNVLNLDIIENILGLLGAGKSTFSMIAANDIIDRGGVVAFLVNDVESALELESQYQQIGAKTTVLKGDTQSENQMLSIMKNKLKNQSNVFSLFKKERESIRTLDPTSQSKAELSRVFKYTEEGRTSDTITIATDNRVKTYINPEVKDSGIYNKLRSLKDSQVIIVNYSAYAKTKIPASLDIFERDFFTAIHLIADVIFIDEVDLAQSKFTEEYISDVSIASSVAEGQFTNNYLEIMTPYVNKVNKDYTFLKNVWDQSQSASNLFNIQKNFDYTEITRGTFSVYSLVTELFERYLNVDAKAIYRLSEFHKLEKLFLKAQRVVPEQEPTTEYERLFYKITIDMREPIFDSVAKKLRIRKKIALFINAFIREEGLEPKKSLYINSNAKEDALGEEQLEIDSSTSFNVDKFLSGDMISDAALVRLLFLFEFCIFNKNQVYLNNETLGFLFRNGNGSGIPNELGRLPIRPNPGIFPYAPKALVKNSHSYTLRRDRDSVQALKIKMKEYKLIGDRVLTESNQFYKGIESTPMPTIIMMSATSYIPTSSMYHNRHTPNYLIKNSQQKDMKINCKFIPVYDGDNLAFVSSNDEKGKKKALKSMIKELSKDGGLFDQQLEKAKIEYENAKEAYESENPGKEYNGRKRVIGIPVTSFKLVYTIKELLNETKFTNKTIAQYRTGDEYKTDYKELFKDANLDEYVTKENVNELHKEDCEIFIFVMSSVGRGYNILQSESSFKSLIGSEFFLVRPYLTAENFSDAIYTLHSMQNDITEQSKYKFHLNNYTPVSEIYKNIVGICQSTYNNLVSRNIMWSSLSSSEKYAIASNYLVLLYQTIGRGLRGGTDLDVFFVDAAFIGPETRDEILKAGIGPNYSYKPLDGPCDSFLSIFETISNSDDFLIQELYSKLGEGLKGIALKQ